MSEQQIKQKFPPINKRLNAVNNNQKQTTDQNTPFNIPNDNQVFRLSKQNSQTQQNGKIWEKNTASCRNPLKRFDKFTVQIDQKYIPSHVYNSKQQKLITDALQLINMRKKNKDLIQKKQKIVEVLSQKKQMFLVTMTHGIIGSQIDNLKNQANERKKALQQSQTLLIKDKKSFQNYQQKYKQQTKKAQQQYQSQVQNRKAKQQLLKNKQITSNSLRAQKIRNEQNVASYLKYKQFLDKLPPKQWIEQQQKIKGQKIKRIKQKYFQKWYNDDFKSQQQSKKSRLKLNLTQQKMNEYNKRFDELMKDEQMQIQIQDRQQIEQINNEQQMYFKQAHELIEYFNNLEQANLFCMQQAQAAKQSFQLLKTQFQQKKIQLQSKYKFLTQHKTSLQKQLNELQFLIKSMRKKKQINNSNISQKDNKDLKNIISKQYTAIKQTMPNLLTDPENNNTQPLFLLSSIQICMEKLLDKLLQASNQHPKLIKQIKNTLQKRKNIQKRQEAAQLNKQEQQKRKSRNLNKKQPVNKAIGRIDMMRSAPKDKQVSKKIQVQDKGDDEDKKYFLQ